MPGTQESNRKGAKTKLALNPNYYIEIGRNGGRKASHKLDPVKAREMANKRWNRDVNL